MNNLNYVICVFIFLILFLINIKVCGKSIKSVFKMSAPEWFALCGISFIFPLSFVFWIIIFLTKDKH